MMIICIPTGDERGVESKAFGHAPYFTLVDVDAVVCEGMGQRALAALNRQGIEVLSPARGTVGEIVEEVRVGNFHRLTPLEACGAAHREYGRGAGVGRGPRRRHGHGHRRGRAAAWTRTTD